MIDFQEYRDAGFTEQQARLLMSRDRRVDGRYDVLTAAITRGFADMQASVGELAATVSSLIREVANGFEAQDHRFEAIEGRLDAIEKRLE